MASFLDTMPASIYAGFKGKLRKGLIRQTAGGTGLDDRGRPIGKVPTDSPLEGFVEAYSAFTRAQAGLPATDLKLNIFAASIPGITPGKDNEARIDYPAANGRPAYSQWYKLRSADTDPAKALWVCQAFEIGDPDGN